MATPINAPRAGEIWHLSIEDLFQQVQEAPRLGGEGPFVINLSVSTAPINVPSKPFASCPNAHVYQIQVTEDGRTRYRLRVGPFATEDEADAILVDVRDTYPAALTATAGAADRRVVDSMQAKIDARLAAAKRPVDTGFFAKPVVEKVIGEKTVIEKAAALMAVAEQAVEKNVARAAQKSTPAPTEVAIEQHAAEISIEIALPPPVRPPSVQVTAAPHLTIVAAPKVAVAPTPMPAMELSPKWVLPELDIPLPNVDATRPVTKIAPLLTQAVVPARKQPAAPKNAPPKAAPKIAVSNFAPVLTEIMAPAVIVPVPKFEPSPPVAAAAPLLTEAVAHKPKSQIAQAIKAAARPIAVEVTLPMEMRIPTVAAPPTTMASPKMVAAAQAPTPTQPPKVTAAVQAPIVPAAPPPVVEPPVAVAAPPPAVLAAPVPPVAVPPVVMPQVVAPAIPPPRIAATLPVAPPRPVASPPAKPAAPIAAAPKAAVPTPPAPAPKVPVMTQSVASPSRAGKFRAALNKPMAARLTSLQHVVVATIPAPAAREVKKLDRPLESLESTQTVRALTVTELEDEATSRWFVIQLALADKAFDPDAVPNLDLFSEYRLYSVAGLDQGRVVHALRLGFFREEIAAVAVASYLGSFWDKPTIKRVSLAERERFADHRVEARKDVGGTGRHAVIEITDELVARRNRSSKSPGFPKNST